MRSNVKNYISLFMKQTYLNTPKIQFFINTKREKKIQLKSKTK